MYYFDCLLGLLKVSLLNPTTVYAVPGSMDSVWKI
jgi:hypothetical protein